MESLQWWNYISGISSSHHNNSKNFNTPNDMYVTSQLLDVLAQHMSSQKDATWWSEQSKGTCCLSHRRETAIDSCHDNIAEFVTSAFGAVARAVPIANQQHHHQDWQHSKCWNPVWWVGKRAHGTTCKRQCKSIKISSSSPPPCSTIHFNTDELCNSNTRYNPTELFQITHYLFNTFK